MKLLIRALVEILINVIGRIPSINPPRGEVIYKTTPTVLLGILRAAREDRQFVEAKNLYVYCGEEKSRQELRVRG